MSMTGRGVKTGKVKTGLTFLLLEDFLLFATFVTVGNTCCQGCHTHTVYIEARPQFQLYFINQTT